MSIEYKRLNSVPAFRKIALGSWRTAADPSVYGLIEIDMTESLKFIENQKKNANVRITPTHLVGKAIAYSLSRRPEINGLIRLGQIYQRQHVDVFFQVNVPGGHDGVTESNVSGALVRRADELSLAELAKRLNDIVNLTRQYKDDGAGKALLIFKYIPTWLCRWALNISSFIQYDLNISLSWAGLPKDPFGSVMITNVGSLGIEMAWAPLVPFTRVPLLLTVGSIQKNPVVIDDKIEIKPIMKIGVTFDHRLIDGAHAAELSQHFKAYLQNPLIGEPL